jgi:hypothetical protein
VSRRRCEATAPERRRLAEEVGEELVEEAAAAEAEVLDEAVQAEFTSDGTALVDRSS